MAISPDELIPTLEDLRRRATEAHSYLKFDELRADIERLEAESGRPGFWDDSEAAQEHMRKLTRTRNMVLPWLALGKEIDEALEMAELVEDDAAMRGQLIEQAKQLCERLDALETRALMSDPEDSLDAYLHIHAGAGGTESCDWAAMLLRMFTRWFERHGYEYEEIEMTDGDEAGIKSVTLQVKGDYAYGQLRAENGIHRLVRISPFDSQSRRHTSFCSVYASPVIDETIDIEIRDEDLKVDTYRASGAGGQHVNKTSSAVRITHLPSKIVVACQNERSQHQNRAQALKMLRSRLYQAELERREAEVAVKNSQKKDIGWGSQIRSYVFQPYQMVKDHRTGHETGNIQAVMDGDLDGFIEAYLRWNAGIVTAPAGSGKELEI